MRVRRVLGLPVVVESRDCEERAILVEQRRRGSKVAKEVIGDLEILLEYDHTLVARRVREHLSERPAVVDGEVRIPRVLAQVLGRVL